MQKKETQPEETGQVKNISGPETDYFSNLDFSKLSVDLETMFKNGVYFGHHKSRKNPKMDEYIFATKNNINILNLEKTAEKLKEAMNYISENVAAGKNILFVGTKKQAKKIVEAAAKRCEMPFVAERWLGGTFTNFPVISSRTKYLRETSEKFKKGEFAKYTKFEQMKLKEELEKLEKKMGGIKEMRELPGALFAASSTEDRLAVKEAKARNIPVVALVDTNSDPEFVDYPIPANEDAVSSIRLLLAFICKAVLEGKSKMRIVANDKANDKTINEDKKL